MSTAATIATGLQLAVILLERMTTLNRMLLAAAQQSRDLTQEEQDLVEEKAKAAVAALEAAIEKMA